jgi:hypothetical protein
MLYFGQGESMIDTAQLSLLLKALDFVFDEGRRILEERRERRKLQEISPRSEGMEPPQEPVVQGPVKEQQIRQELLASQVDELLWQNNQAEIQHLVRLMEIYSRNYHLAREQYAKWGEALVPPIILHNLQEAENAMADTIKRLETALAKVYKKDVSLLK